MPGIYGLLPFANCKRAVESLRSLPGLELAAVSRWYATGSIPPGSPDYVNGVVRLHGDCDPAVLLGRLQAIEAMARRSRPAPNAPRTLDLDIIAMGQAVRETPDPILPHPRAHLRRFVLEPLRDVAPGWVHPRLHQPVDTLLDGLQGQVIEVI